MARPTMGKAYRAAATSESVAAPSRNRVGMIVRKANATRTARNTRARCVGSLSGSVTFTGSGIFKGGMIRNVQDAAEEAPQLPSRVRLRVVPEPADDGGVLSGKV